MHLKTIYGLAEGRQALERHGAHDSMAPSKEARQRTLEIFGEALSPQESVQRILDDVKRQGDKALRHYGRVLDGIDLR